MRRGRHQRHENGAVAAGERPGAQSHFVAAGSTSRDDRSANVLSKVAKALRDCQDYGLFRILRIYPRRDGL
jgi:hypothetical protein